MVRILRWERGLDPSETLDYQIDWTNDLVDAAASTADTISSSTWTFDPANEDQLLTKASPANDDTKTQIFLSAGTVGRIYGLINTIVTTAGRTHERTVQIVVEQR